MVQVRRESKEAITMNEARREILAEKGRASVVSEDKKAKKKGKKKKERNYQEE